MLNWFKSPKKHKNSAPSTPENTRIYAVGDIHGHLKLLQQLQALIQQDAQDAPEENKIVIYIGDYVDRGPHNKEVIDHLSQDPLPGFQSVHIKGNHDIYMEHCTEDMDRSARWLTYGGGATLASYGIALFDKAGKRKSIESLTTEFQQKLPQAHKDFLAQMPLYVELGDYLFVHAGVRPGVPLQDQVEEDFTFIREPFLSTDHPCEKTVVFGHTIFDEPHISPGKIGIDTGAYATGKLTTVVLSGTSCKFLST